MASAMTVDQWSAPHARPVGADLHLGAGQLPDLLLPAVWERYRMLAMEALDRLEGLPAEELRLGHGDLKCDNILAAEDRICLLDLDRTGLADPAMDLGKFLPICVVGAASHSVDVGGTGPGLPRGLWAVRPGPARACAPDRGAVPASSSRPGVPEFTPRLGRPDDASGRRGGREPASGRRR